MDESKLNLFGEYALIKIEEQIKKREKEGKAPFMAYLDDMLKEVREEFSAVLRQYVRDNTLEWHRDVNDKIMFEFKR